MLITIDSHFINASLDGSLYKNDSLFSTIDCIDIFSKVSNDDGDKQQNHEKRCVTCSGYTKERDWLKSMAVGKCAYPYNDNHCL
jgi:hypothetical protein